MVEKMEVSTGLIVVAVSIVLFYLRVALLRGQKKRYEREYALKRRKVSGRSKGAALPTPPPGSPPFGVKSWLLVAISFVIVLAGIVMYNNLNLFGIQLIEVTPDVRKIIEFWYIPVSLGTLLLAFCIKIDKPIMDED